MLIKNTGSTFFYSEAFAWFYGENEPLLLDVKIQASDLNDKPIKLWSAKTGRHLRTLDGDESSETSGNFSPAERLFKNKQLDVIYSKMCYLLAESDFELSTNEGIEFTITWSSTKAYLNLIHLERFFSRIKGLLV